MLSKEERYLANFENCNLFLELGIHSAYYRKKKGFTQQKEGVSLTMFTSFLISVGAGIVAYYVCKWLDGNNNDN